MMHCCQLPGDTVPNLFFSAEHSKVLNPRHVLTEEETEFSTKQRAPEEVDFPNPDKSSE